MKSAYRATSFAANDIVSQLSCRIELPFRAPHLTPAQIADQEFDAARQADTDVWLEQARLDDLAADHQCQAESRQRWEDWQRELWTAEDDEFLLRSMEIEISRRPLSR